MKVERLIDNRKLTKYQVSKRSGIPYATLSDICSGKTDLLKCSADTLYRLSKALDVPMEQLVVMQYQSKERERAYECGLPSYLQHDLDAFKEGIRCKSSLMDCLWGELYASINIAEIDDGIITPEHADYLRNKFLWGKI